MHRRMLTLLRQQPIALLALFLALGGTSVAAVSAKRAGAEAGNVVHGCVGENTGRLRIVSSAANCGTQEMSISFNREGKRGPAGKQGRRGAAGKPGSNGNDGAAGHSGAQGAAGLVGANGAPGLAGAKGDAGEMGEPGENGAKGDPGENGAKGDPGEQGDAGENGVDGEKGDPGENGAKGDPGENGEKATRVDPGENGAKGDKGDNGDKGDQGEAGPAGSIAGAEAGGALTGTFPDPQLAPGSVSGDTIAASSINLSKLGTDVGSLVVDPPSLAAGACNRATVPGVPQAELGDFAMMIPINELSAGIVLEPAFVSTSDLLPYTICNNGAGTVDQGNVSLRARLIPRN